MLTETISRLINEQITKEYYSAYLYLDFANYYNVAGLAGFGNWFTVQAQEERDHALLFSKFLLNNGIMPKYAPIDAPPSSYPDFNAPLLASLEHERFITASIYDIYTEATGAHDYKTIQFLDWFVKEQGEEEKNSEDNIQKFKLFGQDSKGLYMLDAELGARMYAPPTLVI
jgi:ferritin